MKTTLFKASFALLICLSFLIFPSCQKEEEDLMPEQQGSLKSLVMSDMDEEPPTIYYGHQIFTRSTGKPFMETQVISNPKFNCFDGDFVLKIKNGDENKMTRVSSGEILVDGVRIVGPSDFSKNVTFISKPLTGLTTESVLEVKLNSAPGSFIDLWIEGNMVIYTPVFTQIDPLLLNSVAPELPLISNNGITGTWNPETINTSIKGIFTFTFTPNEDQCGIPVTMTINIGVITDVEGNVYDIIQIGNQIWMAQNLKTTHYNNGDPIGTTTPANMNISGETEPKYQWPALGNEDNVAKYGRLYTWYAAMDSRGICPPGWHIATNAEWSTMMAYLTTNGYGFEGSGTDIAKSLASTSDWLVSLTSGSVGNDQESNNTTGFTGYPAGYRTANGIFSIAGRDAYWWTSTEYNSDNSWFSNLRYILSIVRKGNNQNKMFGSAIRCVKDN